MKSPLVWLYLPSAMLLLACNPSAQQSSAKQDSVVKAMPMRSTAASDSLADRDTAATDCPRDRSAPVIQKTVFPAARFALQADGRTGLETLTLADGDQVIITQSGCEYFILKFRFVTSRFAADTIDVLYWSNAALTLMRSVSKGLDVPLDVNGALTQLSRRIDQDKVASQKKLELGEEIDFGGPDPRQYLILERITQLAGQRFAIEVSLNYGPM
jgi:hypothetical protein